MWAVGCIFAELILRHPVFPGTSALDELARIFNIVGTPTEANWPNVTLLPAYVEFEARQPLRFQDIFGANAGPQTTSLLKQMLVLNPAQRITAAQALEHPYFSCDPQPTPPHMLPKPHKK